METSEEPPVAKEDQEASVAADEMAKQISEAEFVSEADQVTSTTVASVQENAVSAREKDPFDDVEDEVFENAIERHLADGDEKVVSMPVGENEPLAAAEENATAKKVLNDELLTSQVDGATDDSGCLRGGSSGESSGTGSWEGNLSEGEVSDEIQRLTGNGDGPQQECLDDNAFH